MWIDPGEYQLEVHTPYNWDPSPSAVMMYPFNVSLTWYDQIVNEDVILYSSGKRIKQIEFLDVNDNVVSKRTYDYNNSGIILSIPYFASQISPGSTGLAAGAYHSTSALPGGIFSTYQGNTIGYHTVTEYYGDAINNYGKTVYQFTFQKDTGDYINGPVVPPTDNEWLRGLPMNVMHYKLSNGLYKKVKTINNRYLYGNDFVNNNFDAPNLLPQIFTPNSLHLHCSESLDQSQDIFYEKTRTNIRLPLLHYIIDPNYVGDPPYYYLIYYFTGGTLDNYKSTETLYDENENPTITTETTTEYDYNNHYQPAKVTSVTSDGIPVVQKFTYPQTITGPLLPNEINPDTYNTNLITALAEQNRFVPIETGTFKDYDEDGILDSGEELNSTKTIYGWFSEDSVLEPEFIQTSKGDNALADRIEFKDYDSDGNVLQVKKTDGMDITYIYGYNNKLPVAKIENATYAQVLSQVANIQSLSDSDDDHCLDSESCNETSLRAALNSLRSSLEGKALVSTYTYDPLIGVTSMTDPKGYTVYYEYDEFNRLVRVKDGDGKIMSENKYHYLLDN